ncbi:MAG TPA: MgtC/SapB family protein [Brevundimonas sp.]|jgi:putative Mg2+ transporter-C (MgtC) family protein
MDLGSVRDALAPILGAVVAGGIIGFEREWRGRPAGFRTHILVSLTSALLMLAAMSQADWAFEALPNENIVTDPTRMAHGVLTGIGFLCAGVIFRNGFSIHGLTTAASLWITAAIGLLFGAGLWELGVIGTAVTALILVGLRLVSARLPMRPLVDVVVCWTRGPASPEAAVEALLQDVDVAVKNDGVALVEAGSMIRRRWRLKLTNPGQLTELARDLARLDGVVSFDLDPRDD